MLDWITDQPAPAPEVPHQPATDDDVAFRVTDDDVDYPDYEDPHGDMPVDDEDMPPPHNQQPEPDLHDDPILLDTGGDPPSQPPGGGTQCLTILIKVEDRGQEARDLVSDLHRKNLLFAWKTMKNLLLLPVLRERFIHLRTLIRFSCRGGHLLDRLFLSIPPHPHFRVPLPARSRVRVMAESGTSPLFP